MYYNFAAKTKSIISMEVKIPVTKLKEYLNDVGIKVKTLADLSGINTQHLHKCLIGEVDARNGNVRTLSNENIAYLQEALHQLSLKLKYTFIFYNTDKEVCKKNGMRYCPDCVSQIKLQLAQYINILPFIQYALGWNRSKVRNVMDNKYGLAYGNISKDDCDRINITLAEMSARLDVFTLTKG